MDKIKTAEELRKDYESDRQKKLGEEFLDIIRLSIKHANFKDGQCIADFFNAIDDLTMENISKHLRDLGYKCSFLIGQDCTKAVISWDTTTEYDRFYITNSAHPCGSFGVKRIEDGEFSQVTIRQMMQWGNYFRTEEDALEVVKELNGTLRKRAGLIEE